MQKVPFWRVCRVLANRPRLKLLGLVSRRPGLCVSDLARSMKLSRPTASHYLRALEGCGFLAGRRRRRSIVYDLGRDEHDPMLKMIMRALIMRLSDKSAIEPIFKLATTFANPGRIDVFRSLNKGAKSKVELKAATGWAQRTLKQHLQKLRVRGFVRRSADKGKYECSTLKDEFACALATAATN